MTILRAALDVPRIVIGLALDLIDRYGPCRWANETGDE